jgi:hypothetical protein
MPQSLPELKPQPDREQYGVGELALFRTYTRDSYKAAFGEDAPPFDRGHLFGLTDYESEDFRTLAANLDDTWRTPAELAETAGLTRAKSARLLAIASNRSLIEVRYAPSKRWDRPGRMYRRRRREVAV